MTDGRSRKTPCEPCSGSFEHIAIAVSGGVDSMTLATFAHRLARLRSP